MSSLASTVPQSAKWPASFLHGDYMDVLRKTREHYPRSDFVHFLFAMLYMFMLPLAPAPASIGFALLATIAALRLYQTWRCYLFLVRDWVMWLFIAWSVWQLASMLWTGDLEQGWEELRAFRVILTGLMLMPMLDRITLLIGALLGGVATQNCVQVGQWLEFVPRKETDVIVGQVAGNRYRGLTHPIVTAALCAMAVCWHACGALRGKGWVQWISTVGLLLAGFGLILTGSRGPWISLAVALPIGFVQVWVRRPHLRKPLLFAFALATLAAASAWLVAGDLITKRIQRAMSDMQKVEAGEYRTDVGYRFTSWRVAWEIFLDHPILGAGAGGFRDAVANVEGSDIIKASNHAHCGYLQVLATTGAIGGVLYLAMILLAVVKLATIASPSIYADGFVAAMASWLVGNVFDVYHLNGMLFGVFAMLLLCAGLLQRSVMNQQRRYTAIT